MKKFVERLKKIGERYRGKMEGLFGLFGVSIAATIIIASAFLTPNYCPIYNTVSSLGLGIAKTWFSIGFVTAGSLGIPFYIYLEGTLIDHDRNLTRFTTLIALITYLGIAFVGILPDPAYPNAFKLFYGFVAFTAFIGSSSYIVKYIYLMDQDDQYPKLLTYLGYFVGGSFLVFIIIFILGIFLTSIFFTSLFEWILTISILAWILSVASFTIFTKKEKFYYLKNLRK
ncbi:hypothetical protein LCGC14_2038910 [marine sediment metagenome]|uniref:DUF998 domain-containing protein n=1 Tax=marine sediment metagenome TaxID=412755 RepID=A0A0F9H5X5_9ZZZZ